MDTLRICQQCRQPLPEDAPEGLCPACLAKVALGSEPAAGGTININPLAEAAPGARVAPDPAHLAAQFPQLEIIELLGMGGMGMVYKARQPRLDRFVALKILPMESAPHPSFAERFSREAKALAKLNHLGIVNIYDFGQTGQYYYFVMEYVDGMNLRHLLKAQTLEPRQALDIVVQICTALQYAHDEGVVHRDIKPENILLNKKGQVKIADFGLAKLLGAAPDTALTMSQAAMGTMNYMAPEQRQNAQGVDHRADIYSLGVVFYEMLTGEVPMGRFEPPSKRVQVDVRLDEVVLRALEREPARRYQQASEVRSGVEAITSAGPEAPPTSPATKPAPDSTGGKVPQFFWLGAYALFTIGWLVTKLLWNFRSPGCWLACFGMAALVVWVSLKRMRLFPETLAGYTKTGTWGRINALGGNFLMLTLGFVFLIGAFFHYWEQGPVGTLFTAKSAEQFEAEYKGKEFHLLQGFAAFSQNIPNVEMAGPSGGGWRGGWDFGWVGRGPGHHWSNVIPDLVFGCSCLLGATLVLIGGWSVPGTGTKLFPFSWRHARATLAMCAIILGSAWPIYVFSEMAYVVTGTHGYNSRSYVFKTDLDTVTVAIEKWTRQNGYAMGDDYGWNINTVPMGNRIAEARLREAWKPSPFDRWRSTWTSFRRVSPYLGFELVGSETPAETHLKVTSVMDQPIPEDLVAELEYLQAMESGEQLLKDNKPADALAQARVALEKKPNDPAALDLQKRAEKALQEAAIAKAQQEKQSRLAEEEEAAGIAKMNMARQFVDALNLYAHNHKEQYPTNFGEVAPYLGLGPGGTNNPSVTNFNQFEIVYHGSLTDIKYPSSPADTIVVRNKQPWQTSDGKWVNAYGFADGHSVIQGGSSAEDLKTWEKWHVILAPSNNH